MAASLRGELTSTSQVDERPALRGCAPKRLGHIVPACLVGVLATLGFVLRVLYPPSAGSFDETIYTQTIRLWLRGFPLYEEIFFSQGPLLVMLLAPFARLKGTSLESLQFGIACWSVAGHLASAAIGYRIGGWWGAVVAIAIMTSSPLLTQVDTQVLAESPAIALAAISVAVGGSGLRLGALAGVALGASLMVKALMPAAALPTLASILLTSHSVSRRTMTLLTFGAAGLITVGICFSLQPWAAAWDQLVTYRLDARGGSGPTLDGLSRALNRGFRDDLGALGAAAIGGLVLAARARLSLVILGAWTLATIGLMAAHQPLFPRHSAALLLPLAALAAGAGMAMRGTRGPLLQAALPLSLVALALGMSAPAHYQRLTTREGSGELEEAARAMSGISRPGDLVLTDLPAIALLADREIVPPLVDLSQVRLATGRLNADLAARHVEQYQPAAILFWLGRLDSGPLEDFPATLTSRYSRVWQNRPGQSLWMREDTDVFDGRAIPDLRPVTDGLSTGGIRASAVSYSGQARAGEVWRLRVLWELEGAPIDIERLEISLSQPGGAPISGATLPFSPEKPTEAWTHRARRMIQYEIPIAASAQPGRLVPRLTIESGDGQPLPFTPDRTGALRPFLELPPIQLARGRSG